jgi:hypothetical protein
MIIIKLLYELKTCAHLFQVQISPQFGFQNHNQNDKWATNLYTLIEIQISPQLGFQDHNQVAKWLKNLYTLIQVQNFPDLGFKIVIKLSNDL